MSDELAGKTFGRYQLLAQLGIGGMSSVYRAYDPAEQREVALKILPAHLASNDIFRQRFFREARTVAHLQHPNILPIYDFGKEGDVLYIVLKLVVGGSLGDAIREHFPLDARTIVRTVTQIAEALDYAHAQGIIHRDLKPENILLDKPNTAYLCDFGIAYSDETMGIVTKSGAFVGTAIYASPEQCQGAMLSPASDIYSFGVVLYEMLTGQPPYDGPTQLAIMHKHVSEPVPNPLELRPDLPHAVGEVIRKALAKPPQVRFQSAGALAGALHEALRHELGSTKPLEQSAAPVQGPETQPIPPSILAELSSRSNVIQPLRRDELPPRRKSSPSAARKTFSTTSRHFSMLLLWGLALVVVLAILLLMLLTRGF